MERSGIRESDGWQITEHEKRGPIRCRWWHGLSGLESRGAVRNPGFRFAAFGLRGSWIRRAAGWRVVIGFVGLARIFERLQPVVVVEHHFLGAVIAELPDLLVFEDAEGWSLP